MSTMFNAAPSGDPSMEDEFAQRQRFQIELEFIQCLANPNYLNCAPHSSLPSTTTTTSPFRSRPTRLLQKPLLHQLPKIPPLLETTRIRQISQVPFRPSLSLFHLSHQVSSMSLLPRASPERALSRSDEHYAQREIRRGPTGAAVETLHSQTHATAATPREERIACWSVALHWINLFMCLRVCSGWEARLRARKRVRA